MIRVETLQDGAYSPANVYGVQSGRGNVRFLQQRQVVDEAIDTWCRRLRTSVNAMDDTDCVKLQTSYDCFRVPANSVIFQRAMTATYMSCSLAISTNSKLYGTLHV